MFSLNREVRCNIQEEYFPSVRKLQYNKEAIKVDSSQLYKILFSKNIFSYTNLILIFHFVIHFIIKTMNNCIFT